MAVPLLSSSRQYRARRDAQSINEITSTLFVLFAGLGAAAYGIFVLVAFHVDAVFNLSPGQTETARLLLLITGTQVAMGLPFGVFGGVVNGFQRYDINNAVSIGTSLTVATVNVTMLQLGYGLVPVWLRPRWYGAALTSSIGGMRTEFFPSCRSARPIFASRACAR